MRDTGALRGGEELGDVGRLGVEEDGVDAFQCGGEGAGVAEIAGHGRDTGRQRESDGAAGAGAYGVAVPVQERYERGADAAAAAGDEGEHEGLLGEGPGGAWRDH